MHSCRAVRKIGTQLVGPMCAPNGLMFREEGLLCLSWYPVSYTKSALISFRISYAQPLQRTPKEFVPTEWAWYDGCYLIKKATVFLNSCDIEIFKSPFLEHLMNTTSSVQWARWKSLCFNLWFVHSNLTKCNLYVKKDRLLILSYFLIPLKYSQEILNAP